MSITGSVLVRNTFVNVLGFLFSIVAAACLIPLTVHELGVAKFGVVALGWTLIGYCAIFEFGLSRSTTHLVSLALGRGKVEEVPGIVWSAFILQLGCGILGAALMWALIPAIVERLQLGPGGAKDASKGLRLLALAIPMIAMTGSLRGFLEAGQQFVVLNAISVFASLSNLGWPAVGAILDWELTLIMGLLAVTRFVGFLAYGSACLARLRLLNVSVGFRFSARSVIHHIRFGGWVTVSAICVPLLINCDRVALAVLSGAEALAYYAAPQEVATRLLVIPASLTTVLFPALSLLVSSAQPDKIRRISYGALTYVVVVSGYVTLFMSIYASDVLRIWLGTDFAREGTTAFRIACMGIFANSLAHVPYAVLHAFGLPRVTARFHLLELLVQPLLAWWLVRTWGITGAAMAWAGWAICDASLLFAFAAKTGILSPTGYEKAKLGKASLLLGVTAVGLAILRTGFRGTWSEALGVVVVIGTAGLVTWYWVFDATERSTVLGVWRSRRHQFIEPCGRVR